MIVAWGDIGSSNSEDEEDKIANLCFMANGKELKGKILNYYRLILNETEVTSTQQIKIIMHDENVEKEYPLKFKTLENKIVLLKYEKEILQDECGRHMQNANL